MTPFASLHKLIASLRDRGFVPRVGLEVGAHPTRLAAVAELVQRRLGVGERAARRIVERRELVSLGGSFDEARDFALELQRGGGRVELVHERCDRYACPARPVDADEPGCAWLMVVGRRVYAARGRPWDWGAIEALNREPHREAIVAAIDAQREAWAREGLEEADSELELLRRISPREPALEARIAAASDDELDEAAAVYADWLQAHGDPRGAVGAAVSSEPRQTSARLLEQLRARYGRHLLGPLDGQLAPDALRWRGPIIVEAEPRATLGASGSRPELIGPLLSLPASAVLRELRVRGVEVESAGLGASLRAAPCRASLRRLSVDASSDLCLSGSFSRLERLTIQRATGRFRCQELDVPALRRVWLGLLAPREDLEHSLAGLRAPALERLALELARVESSELLHGSLVEQLTRALSLPCCARLRHLKLVARTSSPQGRELPRMLARLPCSETLTRIELRGISVTDEARTELAGLRERLSARVVLHLG